MKFSHREDKRSDRLLDVLTDEENGLRLIVSRLGAELISVARRDAHGNWVGFLNRDNETGAPEKGWANHATVMGYYLHRIKNERTRYRGQEIRGGTHSFLRGKVWHFVAPDRDGELTYRITPADFSPAEYPLQVSLDLTYRVEGARLTTIFKFKNDEPELTAHVGFGLHPGFAATSFDSFRFEMPAGLYRRHFSPENYLSGETEDIQFAGGEMPFPKENLKGSYILELVDVPERIFSFSDPPSGRLVAIDLTGVPYLTLWSDGGPFLCVEPCWGLTDHHDQRAFENKEGIQTIPTGDELIAGFSIEPRLARVRFPEARSFRRSPFLGVVQVHPGLDIIAICPAKSFLGRLQVGAGFVPPAAFGKKRIPNEDFFFARFFPSCKTPIENFFIGSALKRSGSQLIIIHAEKPGAARVEEGRIFHA